MTMHYKKTPAFSGGYFCLPDYLGYQGTRVLFSSLGQDTAMFYPFCL
jgi:hypothetical protein